MAKKQFKVNSKVGFIEPMSEEIKGPNRVSWFFSRLTDHWLAPNMRCDVRLPTPAGERVRYSITFAPSSIIVRASAVITRNVIECVHRSPCDKEPLEFWQERFSALRNYLMRGYGYPEDARNPSLVNGLSADTLEESYEANGNVTLVFGQRLLVVESWPGDQRQARPKIIATNHGLTWRSSTQDGLWEDTRSLHDAALRLACPWPLTGKEP